MAILEVKNITKSFKDPYNINIKVVNNISFSINTGEVLGIVGESGSGKTTLGRMIIRLINPDSGKIKFNDLDITKLSKRDLKKVRKNMQIIFQDPFSSLNPRMLVREIISN